MTAVASLQRLHSATLQATSRASLSRSQRSGQRAATMAPAAGQAGPLACMAGTREAASAHSTVMAAPAYRWGPGNSLPARGRGQRRHCGWVKAGGLPVSRVGGAGVWHALRNTDPRHRHIPHPPHHSPASSSPPAPVRRKVLNAPETLMVTPRPSSRLPQLLCCSFSFLPISSLRSCTGR